jgi:large conductance mechanosensitive channel
MTVPELIVLVGDSAGVGGVTGVLGVVTVAADDATPAGWALGSSLLPHAPSTSANGTNTTARYRMRTNLALFRSPETGQVTTVIGDPHRPSHLGDAVIRGFREFITKGNVIDLAVAVVIGAAFTQVINAVVQWLITPLIAAIFGQPNLNDVATFTINGAQFSIGAILSQVINFLLVAAAVYFVLVAPMNAYREMRASGEEEEPGAPPEDLLVLQEIRDLIRDRRGAI